MRAFVNGFLDGFTGAGMFLGPQPVQREPLCEPESLIETDGELLFALKQIFTMDEDSSKSRQKERIAAETRRTILEASIALRNTSTVKSGS